MDWLNSKYFFYLEALVVIVIIGFLLKRPTMRSRFRFATRREKNLVLNQETKSRAEDKPLNVLFNFNGHTWDAYEVLGVPAGSSWLRVEDAYRQVITNVADNSSREFYDMAYSAIKKHTQYP